jgi:regulator of nonsense transcripts 1
MVEQNIAESTYPFQEAQRHVHDSRLVFTTCVGAGLGLLRSEMFDIVLLVNAAQQTRSESLIPLSKGCHRAIFIGDHAKPRVKVRKHATIADFDISLFERFYGMVDTPGVARVLLDTQYEVHRDICDFNSKEFYQNKLRSLGHNTSLPPSTFPWPKNHRMVFLQSGAPEDLGRQSKVNQGQVKICQTVFALLQSAASPAEQNVNTTQIVILTPYTRQKCVMQKAMPTAEICTVGEFQDRSADIVVFVSVRCNAHLELGYLRDARLMNTVMMGAKAGIIIIGDKPTLTGMEENSCDTESKAMWGRLLTSCVQVELQANEPRPRPNIA